MAEITAALVKELREISGAGMMDCKKALVETNGNLDDASDWLRKKGLAAAAKKAGRVAAEGLVGAVAEGTRGALVEVMCQLRPGARVDVHLENDDRREMVGASVTRCAVATIDPDAGITYRAALCFLERCEWVCETATLNGSALPGEPAVTTAVTSVGVDRLPESEEIEIARGSK